MTKLNAWHLPWGARSVSHGILDINRGCNIACRACYNALPPAAKPLAQIEAELRVMQSHRRLAYVSLVGGEVLLHPQLGGILRLLKAEGLCVQLFTNGLLLDDRRLAEFQAIGLDVIYLHIERGQARPDLPPDPAPGQLRRLWADKAALIARHGIDVGMSLTAFPGRLDEVREVVEFVVDSPHANYLLVTMFRDTANMMAIEGDLDSGMRGTPGDPARAPADTLTNREIIDDLQQAFGFRPFAYLGSNRSAEDPRWLTCQVATRRRRDGGVTRYALRASLFEHVYCILMRRLAGRYPMVQRQSTAQLVVQLLLNALSGGDLAGNLGFLLRACRPGVPLGTKRLLFQCPAQVEPDGSVTHCLNCPDAVVKNGRLVPLCICDKVT